eukprot:1397796-Pyramimonas_sp.AAC.1
MLFEGLYDLITYGYWRVETKGIECFVATIDAPAITVTENDLIQMRPSLAEVSSVCAVVTMMD